MMQLIESFVGKTGLSSLVRYEIAKRPWTNHFLPWTFCHFFIRFPNDNRSVFLNSSSSSDIQSPGSLMIMPEFVAILWGTKLGRPTPLPPLKPTSSFEDHNSIKKETMGAL